MKKVYYAHPLSLYDTPQEGRDITMLEALGFEVFNPNSEECEKGYASKKMGYFTDMMPKMDALAFRCIPGGKIPAGIGDEIRAAVHLGKPVFELPNGLLRRMLSVDHTREYLRDIGQR